MAIQSGQEVANNPSEDVDSRTRYQRLLQRIDGLDEIRGDVVKAERALAGILAQSQRPPDQIAVRSTFIRRRVPASGEISDSRPPREGKPPAIDLISPNGIGQQLMLVAIFVAQTIGVTQAQQVTLPLPLDGLKAADDQWIDLVVANSRHSKETIRATILRENRLRQFKNTLKGLWEKQLIDLPNIASRRHRYEGFRLMDEGGRRPNGLPLHYTKPGVTEPQIQIPLDFFMQGWIYCLTKSEIALWLMIRDLSSTGDDDGWVYITGHDRLRLYGVTHEAYKGWPVLKNAGLIEVQVDPRRREDGTLDGGYDGDDPVMCHRFRLTDEGLSRPAEHAVANALLERDTEIRPT